jgi:hypothetical protein
MHFSFNLLRIKGLYMFRALLVHPQEILYKRHLVYCVRIMSVGCGTIAHARNIPNAVCTAPPEDEQVMLETCRGPWFSVNWIKSASRWFHYTEKCCCLKFCANFCLKSGPASLEWYKSELNKFAIMCRLWCSILQSYCVVLVWEAVKYVTTVPQEHTAHLQCLKLSVTHESAQNIADWQDADM